MSKKSSTFAAAFEKKQGKMAEWSIASVLKTEVRKRTGGSNPSLSAACWDYVEIPQISYEKLSHVSEDL